MHYESVLAKFLSTCDGLVRDVFFSLYTTIESFDEKDQPSAIMYLCENAFTIKSDSSNRIEKEFYTDKQVAVAEQKIIQKFDPALNSLIEESSKNSVSPAHFYKEVWALIQSSIFKTKRERALALFRLVDHSLIPYRCVGIGLTMDQETYESAVENLGESILKDTEYILRLGYEQKTQCASLLVDKLLSLENKEDQAVYMTIIINEIENNIKGSIKDAIERI